MRKGPCENLREEDIIVQPFYEFKCPIKPQIENIDGGKYLHIGLMHHLKKMSNTVDVPETISIDINIDGLPLYRSSKAQPWPILIRVNNVKSQPVFPIEVFYGHSKPKSCDEFLCMFVDDLCHYMDNGLEVDGKYINLNIRAVICNAPARAFIAGTPSHVSRHGCMKCTQIGLKIDNVLTYSTASGTLITDNDFVVRKYPNHHSKIYLNKETALENLNIGMITQMILGTII